MLLQKKNPKKKPKKNPKSVVQIERKWGVGEKELGQTSYMAVKPQTGYFTVST
jgi:hypothetical protein